MPAHKKIGLYIFQIILWLLLSTKSVYGGTAPTFSNLPGNISVDQEIEVGISFAGDPRYYKEKTYYLRGVFYQQDKKYCSLTQNNAGEWIVSGTTPSDLFEFTTNPEGSWSGKLKVRVDKESSSCSGSGEYQFKVGRYTSSSASWSESRSIQVINPTPAPEPTLAPKTETTSSGSNDSNQESSYDSDEEELIPQTAPIPKGVVAGFSTQESPTATFSDSLQIGEAIPSTRSAEITFEEIAIDEADLKSSQGSNSYILIAGGTLTSASIVSFLLRKYNKPSIWKKIKQIFKTS